jgi:hypothetical protein
MEKFSGRPSDDTDAYIDNFKIMKGIYGWKDNDARNFFIGLLDGPAKNYYYSFKTELDQVEGLEAFLDKFKENLPSCTSDPYSALFARKKLETESSTEYFYSVLRLCQRADPKMTESQKVQHILKGVDSLMLEFLTQRDCQTVDELHKQMNLYEKARFHSRLRNLDSQLSTLKVSEPEAPRSPNQPFRSPTKRRGRFGGPRKFNLVKQMRNLNLSDSKEPIICFQCGKPGHVRRNCFKNPANFQNRRVNGQRTQIVTNGRNYRNQRRSRKQPRNPPPNQTKVSKIRKIPNRKIPENDQIIR